MRPKPPPKLAGLALRAAASAIAVPGLAGAMVALLRRQLGIDALRSVDLRRHDAPPLLRWRVAPSKKREEPR